MKIQHYETFEKNAVNMPGAHDCTVRWLVGRNDGAPTFAMRQFEVAPGGFTPHHLHDYEHEVFVLEGEGVLLEGNTQHRLTSGDVVYVAPNEVHQFRNTGAVPLKFLCLVPNSSYDKPVTMAAECAER